MKKPFILLVGILAVYFFFIRKAGASQIDSGGLDVGNPLYFSMGKLMSTDGTQSLSNNGKQILKRIEGFRSQKYPDPPNSGKFSIGYGHQIRPDENYDSGIDEATASLLLDNDVSDAENTVNGNVSATLTQNQFDALVIFVYNVGSHAFTTGTVPQKLNDGDFAAATATMGLYINSGGAPSVALRSRRVQEINLFNA